MDDIKKKIELLNEKRSMIEDKITDAEEHIKHLEESIEVIDVEIEKLEHMKIQNIKTFEQMKDGEKGVIIRTGLKEYGANVIKTASGYYYLDTGEPCFEHRDTYVKICDYVLKDKTKSINEKFKNFLKENGVYELFCENLFESQQKGIDEFLKEEDHYDFLIDAFNWDKCEWKTEIYWDDLNDKWMDICNEYKNGE